QVHGVVLADITHQVPPGDVRAAQYILSRVWQRFPQGTVHLAVVDPGVGTDRRALAAQTAGHFFVAPDNGLLSFLSSEAHFGTLISNIPGGVVEPGVRIRVAGTEIGTLARTFGDVKRGVLVAFVGSGGTVEIAVRDGSAARLLGVGVGAEVRA